MLSVPDQHNQSQPDATTMRSWNRRLIISLTILALIALTGILLWGIGHISTKVLIVLIAALLAYAIVPVIAFFHRVMPRPVEKL